MSWALYSRKNCHLCEAFELELNACFQKTETRCETVDVDSQPELQALYGNDVPVLTFNKQIICQHFFDKEKTLKELS